MQIFLSWNSQLITFRLSDLVLVNFMYFSFLDSVIEVESTSPYSPEVIPNS